jgi:hypothetical protein
VSVVLCVVLCVGVCGVTSATSKFPTAIHRYFCAHCLYAFRLKRLEFLSVAIEPMAQNNRLPRESGLPRASLCSSDEIESPVTSATAQTVGPRARASSSLFELGEDDSVGSESPDNCDHMSDDEAWRECEVKLWIENLDDMAFKAASLTGTVIRSKCAAQLATNWLELSIKCKVLQRELEMAVKSNVVCANVADQRTKYNSAVQQYIHLTRSSKILWARADERPTATARANKRRRLRSEDE